LALCKEIGERLGISMGQMSIEMPPHLMMLMKRLRDENSRSVQTLTLVTRLLPS
jgi:hypothetical protein